MAPFWAKKAAAFEHIALRKSLVTSPALAAQWIGPPTAPPIGKARRSMPQFEAERPQSIAHRSTYARVPR